MSAAFVTLSELEALTGVSYDAAGVDRVNALIPHVSNLIRAEGKKYGVDVDAKIASDPAYESVVKLITCDVIGRAMRQSTTGDPLSQRLFMVGNVCDPWRRCRYVADEQ